MTQEAKFCMALAACAVALWCSVILWAVWVPVVGERAHEPSYMQDGAPK
jgi:hypothetical protein